MNTVIRSTTDYGMFKDIRGNRELNRVYLKSLMKSIEENNLLPYNPVLVNEEMQVIDGQHRLEACKNLEIPVYYIVTPTGSINEIKLLNNNIRNWTMKDFLKSYVDRGFSHYQTIQDYMEKTGFSLSISLVLLSGSREKKGTTIQDFKNGDFKVTHLKYAIEMFVKLQDLSKFTENDSWNDREFISALIKVYKAGFSHAELVEKFSKSRIIVPRFSTRREYVRVFENVLSYKLKAPVRLI